MEPCLIVDQRIVLLPCGQATMMCQLSNGEFVDIGTVYTDEEEYSALRHVWWEGLTVERAQASWHATECALIRQSALV